MKYLIGNWKSNFSTHEAQEWIEAVKPNMRTVTDKLEIVLCPSFIHLLLFKLNFPNLQLGAQTISPFGSGTYTGFTSSYMLKEMVSYVIVGHSERRTYAKESISDVDNQVIQALDMGLTPIIAVDKENWFAQLSLINKDDMSKCIIMYEPPEAISEPVGKIGQGTPAPVEEVVDMIRKIKDEFTPKAAIYGGSVKSHNIKIFIEQNEIDGVLPGSASLDSAEWLKMIQIAIQVVSNQ